MDAELLKQQVGEYVIDHFVESGMILGLGVGSTAIYALRRLAQKLASGELEKIISVPCGRQIQEEARRLQIPLTTLDQHPRLDLTFDGADEVDPALNLIKGGGGALLREKIVAQASQREIILVDASKQVPFLGTNWALPIEIIPFALGSLTLFLQEIGGQPQLRLKKDGSPFITDEGHAILDTRFGPIHDPHRLARQLEGRAGVVEHGLFLGLATDLLVASPDGIQHIQRRGF